MRTSLVSNNFSSGLVNESINGRYDLPLYRNGLAICENFTINSEGGLKNRTGLIKLLSTVNSFMIDFVVSKTEAYIVQFTSSGKIRFLTYSASGIFGYILDSNNNIYEISSPFSFSQAKQIQFAQKEDVMYICHPSYVPKKLKRLTPTTFSISDVIFDGISPFTSATGYPSAVCFYENRLFYGGIKNKPTFVYASDVGDYDKFTLNGTNDNLNGFNFDLVEINQKIDWALPIQNTLICGATDGLLYCNGGGSLIAMTKINFQSRKASNDGTNGVKPTKIGNSIVYIDNTERNVRGFTYDLISESFSTDNLNVTNNDYTVSGIKQIVSLKNKYLSLYVLLKNGDVMFCNLLQNEGINCWTYLKFHNEVVQLINIPRGYDTFEDLIFLVKENGNYYLCKLADEVEFRKQDEFFTGNQKNDKEVYQRYVSEKAKSFIYLDMCKTFTNEYTSTITYNDTNKIITSTGTDFSSGDVGKRIVYRSIDGNDYGTFEITGYINSNSVYVESIRSNGYSATVWSDWYKTFGSLTISDSYYYNKKVSVVGDGGYIGEFDVDNSGHITFEKQLTSVVIGFKYTSTAKTLNLGYDINGSNTQITNKNISKVNIRFLNSAGGKCGTDRYDLKKIQQFNPDGYYDNIPLLMNGDVEINIEDNWDKTKSFYMVQEEPLPFNISMLTITRDDNLK